MPSADSQFVEYRQLLRSELDSRRAANSLYSARAFARDLGISKTALSEILQQRRHLSPKNARRVAERLCFSPDQTRDLFASIRSKKPADAEAFPSWCLREDTFRVIADWYHFAILNLSKIRSNRSSPHWVAARLGISPLEAKLAIDRLRRLGLLETEGGRLRRTLGSLDTGNDIPSAAIRKYHKQNLRNAELSLERDPVLEREITSITVAVDSKRLKQAKRMIREFRTRMAEYLESDRPSRVYTFAMQLFPVSSKARVE